MNKRSVLDQFTEIIRDALKDSNISNSKRFQYRLIEILLLIMVIFSTDTGMSGKDVIEYYRVRFQIEFKYRDGKQFTGLKDCQARNEDRLDFAFNASLAAINVA